MPTKQSPTSFTSRLYSLLSTRYSLTKLLFVVKVEGESAWPELIPGKYYFATSLLRPKVGRYAVFKNPKKPKQILVKKISAVERDSLEVSSSVSWGKSMLQVKRNNCIGVLIA